MEKTEFILTTWEAERLQLERAALTSTLINIADYSFESHNPLAAITTMKEMAVNGIEEANSIVVKEPDTFVIRTNQNLWNWWFTFDKNLNAFMNGSTQFASGRVWNNLRRQAAVGMYDYNMGRGFVRPLTREADFLRCELRHLRPPKIFKTENLFIQPGDVYPSFPRYIKEVIDGTREVFDIGPTYRAQLATRYLIYEKQNS